MRERVVAEVVREIEAENDELRRQNAAMQVEILRLRKVAELYEPKGPPLKDFGYREF